MTIPHHVAIIMDGNGRWAVARGLPRVAGHRAGIDALKRTLKAVQDQGIKILTIYAFSSENWHRPAEEVSELMNLLRHFLRAELAQLHKDGVRLRFIGQHDLLPQDVQALLTEAQNLTQQNTSATLVVALSYGARQEIARAARALADQVAAGTLQPAEITEQTFAAALDTADIPDPDLLIRTSGEMRLSNFLLWQTAYTEFVFTDTLWPDFGAVELAAAIQEFQQRERRYGKLGRLA